MTKTILILGGSYAALTIAHTLLKKTLNTVKDLKVVIVSPNRDFYMNTASVRGIVPGQFSDAQLFAEIAPGFARYPKGSFEHKIGTATNLDPEAKTVTVTTAAGEEKQVYDILVIATGSRTESEAVPWKQSPKGTDFTKDTLHKVQEQVKAAKSIILGGGGATAVETAGELAFEFKKTKDITIITSGSQLISASIPKRIADGAESQLVSMGVKVVKGTNIVATSVLPSGQTEVTLSNGEKVTCNLYLPTVGVIPNNEFIPKTLLNDKGELVVDEYLKVKNIKDVWAAGDITSLEASTFVNADKQATHLAKSLGLVLAGKASVAYKYGGPPAMGVTLGRSKGTGVMGDKKAPSILIWWFKGRTMGTQFLKPYVTGTKF